jgi:16S rRNA (guanine966-N2)-methyltransferase
MRVVAGTARGRRLVAPEGRDTRPTSDLVREAVFSMLFSLGDVQDLAVLDLFAGSGALGIEALSRDARVATFVDEDASASSAIQANLAACGFTDRATVRREDVDRFLASTQERFDLVFVDPPYAFGDWRSLLARLPADLAVLESDREVELGESWQAVRCRRYGSTVVTIARTAAQEHM